MLGDAADGPERTVVLPLLHGPMGEDGTVQGMLELANVAYVGAGVLGSAVAMDKAMAKQVLAARGIPQARYRAFAEHELTPGLPAELADELGLPCFVKPANMGSSVGVTKATTVEELRDAIEHALTYDEWVVVEEAIVGREIEVAVIGNNDPRRPLAGRDHPRRRVLQLRRQVRERQRVGLVPAPLTPERWTMCARSRCGCTVRCVVTGWRAATSSSRRGGRVSCATRSTRCPASRRSPCSPRC